MGRRIDYLKVKGKSRVVRVYEALALQRTATAGDQNLCERYQAAFDAYRQRGWDRAQRLLEEILERQPDGPAGAGLSP